MSSDPNFIEHANEVISPMPGMNGVVVPRPHVRMTGSLRSTTQFTSGSQDQFDATTDLLGTARMYDIKVGSFWDLGARWNQDIDVILDPTSYTHCAPAPNSGITENPSDPDQFYASNVFIANPKNLSNGQTNDITWTCYHTTSIAGTSPQQFTMMGSSPTQITFTSHSLAFKTNAGNPQLYLYGNDSNGNMAVQNIRTASYVSADSANATFPFPTNSDGSSLNPGLYSVGLMNSSSDGSLSSASSSFLSVGRSIPFSQPYAVTGEAVVTNYYSHQQDDPYNDGTCAGQSHDYSSANTLSYPVVTQYSSGTAVIGEGGSVVPVGQNPIAIALYHPYSQSTFNTYSWCSNDQTTTTSHHDALVVNSGSNSVTSIDLVGLTTTQVSVGVNPIGLAVSSDSSKAFIVNAGDNSVSLVDLGTLTQTAKVGLAAKPSSIALDTSGNVWVGGAGYLTRFDTNLNSPISVGISGTTVALRNLPTASEMVATRMDGGGGLYMDELDSNALSAGTIQVNGERQMAALGQIAANGQFGYSYATASAATPIIGNSMLEIGSADGSSWMTVSGTPQGFVLNDAISHRTMLTGNLGSAVTSISVDSDQKMAYLASPDSNQVVAIDLP